MTSPMDRHPDPSPRSIDQGNQLNEEEIRRTIEFYETQIGERTSGPQLEGLESNNLEVALRDNPNVVLIDIHDDTGEVVRWPLLTPIEHHIDYSQDFFPDHFPDQKAYYFSLPPYDNIEELIGYAEEFASIAERLKSEKAVIAFDFLKDHEDEELIPGFLQEMLADSAEIEDVTPDSMLDGISYGSPKVVHYEGLVEPTNPSENPAQSFDEAFARMVERGDMEDNPGSGVSYLTAEKLRANDGILLDQIWEVYSDQFNTLTEDHPSLQKQPREELERMLLGNDAVNIAYMEEGKVAGLLYFVHDIESCVWLNKKFYDENCSEDKGWLAYYPGIVVAKERARQGLGYAQEMIAKLADAAEETGKKMIVTCQCTNVSMTYVTKMVAAVINNHERLNMIPQADGEAFKTTAEYGYKVIQVNPKGDQELAA